MPSHVAVPFIVVGHGAHAAPHVAVLLLETHAAPQRWKPGLHVYPQPPPLHVGVEFAGALQVVPHAPQLDGSVWMSTQDMPQRVGVAPPQPLVQVNDEPLPEHTGVLPPQTVPHIPQELALDRSVSHPFAAEPSQLAHPASHAIPHETPSHVADACAALAQAVQDDVPHEETAEFDAHAPAHRWNPALQLKPHAVPLHVAVALAGAVHATHELPHDATDVLLTHAPAHK